MKNYITGLFVAISFIASAQFSIGIQTAPLALSTETTKQIPIGVELKASKYFSLYFEKGISLNKNTQNISNNKASKTLTQFRVYYKPQDKFKGYIALERSNFKESYTKNGGSYKNISKRTVRYEQADINTSNKGIGLRVGKQAFFKDRFFVDLNAGFAINHQSVKYTNILNAETDPSLALSYLAILGSNTANDQRNLFEAHPDPITKTRKYANFVGSIRVGYLLFRG